MLFARAAGPCQAGLGYSDRDYFPYTALDNYAEFVVDGASGGSRTLTPVLESSLDPRLWQSPPLPIRWLDPVRVGCRLPGVAKHSRERGFVVLAKTGYILDYRGNVSLEADSPVEPK